MNTEQEILAKDFLTSATPLAIVYSNGRPELRETLGAAAGILDWGVQLSQLQHGQRVVLDCGDEAAPAVIIDMPTFRGGKHRYLVRIHNLADKRNAEAYRAELPPDVLAAIDREIGSDEV